MPNSDRPSNLCLVVRLAFGAVLFVASFLVVRPLALALGMQGPQQSLLMLIPALAAILFFRFDRYIERARGTASPQIELFQNRYLICIFAHIALLVVANAAEQLHWASGIILAGLIMLPAIPLLALIYVFGRNLIEEQDEFQRLQQTQASLWATSLLLVVAMVWGALEQQGLARHAPASAAFYIWWFGMAIAKIFLKIRA